MPQTSDTEFYSLSLNSLAPPPYSPRAIAHQEHSSEHVDEKQPSTTPGTLLRRLTSPFSGNTNTSTTGTSRPAFSSRIRKLGDHCAEWVINWWLWELCSWATSALCIFAIAFLLGYYDSEVIPDEWPLGITLNAYIAVLGGIAKYTLAVPVDEALGQLKWHFFAHGPPKPLLAFERFDDASRGPWGALALFVYTKGRSIVSLAAIVTVLSLALDPFFQQLVTFPKRPTPNSRSSIPRVVNFTAQVVAFTESVELDVDAMGPDRWLETTMNQHLINNGSDIAISPYCPGEECAWTPFDTLAICSQCQDVSSMLTFACLPENGDWKMNHIINSTEDSSGISCGYFLNATNEKPVLMAGYVQSNANSTGNPDESLLMRVFNLHDINSDVTYWNGSINFKSAAFPIVDFIQTTFMDREAVFQNATPRAEECVISWCTNRISAYYQNGVYSEHVMSKAFGDMKMSDPLLVTTTTFDPSVLDFYYLEDVIIKPPGQDSTFFVPNRTALQTIFLFQKFAPSLVTANDSSAPPVLRTALFLGAEPLYYNYIVNPFDDSPSISGFHDRMAASMSNMLRIYPSNKDKWFGTGSTEVYIHARWGFLALPLTLLLSTLVVLIVTMLKQEKNGGLGIWKTSSLATMVHGIDDDIRAGFTSTQRLQDVFERAANTNVLLYTEEGRSRLVFQNH